MNRILGIGSELGAGGIPALRSHPNRRGLDVLCDRSQYLLSGAPAKACHGMPQMYVHRSQTRNFLPQDNIGRC
jgi:hypothetical protein